VLTEGARKIYHGRHDTRGRCVGQGCRMGSKSVGLTVTLSSGWNSNSSNLNAVRGAVKQPAYSQDELHRDWTGGNHPEPKGKVTRVRITAGYHQAAQFIACTGVKLAFISISMERSFSLEAASRWLLSYTPTFYRTQRFITVFTRSFHACYMCFPCRPPLLIILIMATRNAQESCSNASYLECWCVVIRSSGFSN
jgi:hypothetical protein